MWILMLRVLYLFFVSIHYAACTCVMQSVPVCLQAIPWEQPALYIAFFFFFFCRGGREEEIRLIPFLAYFFSFIIFQQGKMAVIVIKTNNLRV